MRNRALAWRCWPDLTGHDPSTRELKHVPSAWISGVVREKSSRDIETIAFLCKKNESFSIMFTLCDVSSHDAPIQASADGKQADRLRNRRGPDRDQVGGSSAEG